MVVKYCSLWCNHLLFLLHEQWLNYVTWIECKISVSDGFFWQIILWFVYYGRDCLYGLCIVICVLCPYGLCIVICVLLQGLLGICQCLYDWCVGQIHVFSQMGSSIFVCHVYSVAYLLGITWFGRIGNFSLVTYTQWPT